ncbi:MAG: ABC transporter ATP-binding protein [Actinomycetota bacterium]
MVRAIDLTRTFGRDTRSVSALVGATFEMYPGERLALIGPSGSGKSTLLHLVAGLDRPTSGSIEWPALGPPVHLRPGRVGVAFQGPSLVPALTVLENVALPLLLMGRPESEADAEAARLIARFDLEDVAAKLPEELSGGQQQRAAVARALAGEPALILADEPTGQQDRVTGQRVIDGLLAGAGESGAALVVATHDGSVAGRMADRWMLRDGRLLTGERVASSP